MGFQKGDILRIAEQHNEALELNLDELIIVLESPDSLGFLKSYMLQPLGIGPQIEGMTITPAYTVPARVFDEGSFEKMGAIDPLNWHYFGGDCGKSLSDLVMNNPDIGEWAPIILVR
jgi:hypothetical protein